MPNVIRTLPKAEIINIEVLEGGILYIHANLAFIDANMGFHRQYNVNDYASLNQLAATAIQDIKDEWDRANNLLQITREYRNYSIDW